MYIWIYVRTVPVSMSLSSTLYIILSHNIGSCTPRGLLQHGNFVHTTYVCKERMCTVRILQGKFHKFDQIPKMKHWGSFHNIVLSLKGAVLFMCISWPLRKGLLCKTTLLSYPVHLQCYTYKCIHVATWCMRCSHVCTCTTAGRKRR